MRGELFLKAAELQAAGKEIIFTNGACVGCPSQGACSTQCLVLSSALLHGDMYPTCALCVCLVIDPHPLWWSLFALCMAPQSGTPTSWVQSPSPSHARCAYHTLLASLPGT